MTRRRRESQIVQLLPGRILQRPIDPSLPLDSRACRFPPAVEADEKREENSRRMEKHDQPTALEPCSQERANHVDDHHLRRHHLPDGFRRSEDEQERPKQTRPLNRAHHPKHHTFTFKDGTHVLRKAVSYFLERAIHPYR